MKNSGFILLVLLLGVLSISATKADTILGKWVAYKVTMVDGKTVKIKDLSKSVFYEFKGGNIMLVGEGEQKGTEQQWLYEEEMNKLFFIKGEEQVECDVLKFSEKILILEIKKSSGNFKFCLKKVTK